AELRAQRLLEGRAVERGGFFRFHLTQCLALYEAAAAFVDRRELVVAGGERRDFGPNAEELADEVLEMRRERDQELRLGFGRQGVRIRAGGLGPGGQSGVRRPQRLAERGIEPQKAVARVEIAELETESQG